MIRHRQERLLFLVPLFTEDTSGCPGFTTPNMRKSLGILYVLYVEEPVSMHRTLMLVGQIQQKESNYSNLVGAGRARS